MPDNQADKCQDSSITGNDRVKGGLHLNNGIDQPPLGRSFLIAWALQVAVSDAKMGYIDGAQPSNSVNCNAPSVATETTYHASGHPVRSLKCRATGIGICWDLNVSQEEMSNGLSVKCSIQACETKWVSL